ncbi:MAG: GTPase [Burkholderiaceae bacterium]
MTNVTLVTGSSYAAREAAIAAALRPGMSAFAILEGLPNGKPGSPLEQALPSQRILRIAPGCPCCTGSLTMRVTLNRVLRHAPQHLFIGLADTSHLQQFRDFLRTDSYSRLLTLTEDLHIAP